MTVLLEGDKQTAEHIKRYWLYVRRTDMPESKKRVELFKIARIVCKRLYHKELYESQYLSAFHMYEGRAVEMATGSGKSLAIILACFLALSLRSESCYVVSVNEYLVSRDAEFAKPFWDFFGIPSGFLLERDDFETSQRNYMLPVLFVTQSKLVFDLIEGMVNIKAFMNINFNALLITDELDLSVLDNAVSPFVISDSNTVSGDRRYLVLADALFSILVRDSDYITSLGNVNFTEKGLDKIET